MPLTLHTAPPMPWGRWGLSALLACALWYLITKNVEKNPRRLEQGTPPSKLVKPKT